MKYLLALLMLGASSVASARNLCERYEHKPEFMKAIEVQAKNMKYTTAELCHLPHLLDIYVVDTDLVNQRNQVVPHVWLTLHYSEHSCQYFLKADDFSTTKKNCYNTF